MWTFSDREVVAVTAPGMKGWDGWLLEARARLDAARVAGAEPQVLAAAQAAVEELQQAMCEAAEGPVQ